MKKLLSLSALILMSLSVFSQVQTDKQPTFIYQIGVGKSFFPHRTNYSSWGAAYRTYYDAGLFFHAKASYAMKDGFTLGLKYEMTSTGANFLYDKTDDVIDNILLNYVAPQLGSYTRIGDRLSFTYNVGLGYVFYKSEGLIGASEFKNKAGLLGANVDLSVAYRIRGNMSVGLETSIFNSLYSKDITQKIGGTESKVTPNKWDKLNLGKLALSIVLRATL